jgi:ferredoxin
MPAELHVDFARCTGHGRCYYEAEDLLTEDEEGFVTVRHQPMALSDDQLPEAALAAAACPEGAMSIRFPDEHKGAS